MITPAKIAKTHGNNPDSFFLVHIRRRARVYVARVALVNVWSETVHDGV